MLHLNLTNKAIAAAAAVVLYVALATWAKMTWVNPIPKGKLVLRLKRPFEKFGAFGAVSYQVGLPILESLADTYTEPDHLRS